jgi:polyisoprenyl-phosphate glycosyltransferase
MVSALRGPIVVLGGAGFIGANLFLRMFPQRQDVFAVVRKLPAWRLEGVIPERILEVDITDEAATRNLIDSINPQTVFDCVSYGAYSFENDERLIYRTNFNALIGLVELIARKPFSAYVHAGSSSEYGINSAGPAEDATLKPNSHYAVSKAAMTQYIHFVGRNRSLPCVNLRLYSVYGPLEDTSRLIPNLLFQGLKNKYPPFVDAETARDFIYIDDVCDAFYRAAAKMNPDMYGRSYNIGSGKATTIQELAAIAQDLFLIQEEPHFNAMPARQWDLQNWFADPTAAQKDLGWTPHVELRDGLLKTKSWVAELGPEEIENKTKLNRASRKKSLSAIIACYRDEQAIPLMHERLTKVFQNIGCEYEIIFVNDCSPDRTQEVILEISARDAHVLGISHSRNFGSQMAFRSGMELSTKDGVVLLDGDLQDPPELIEQFYEQWEKGYDVIYGRRIKRDMPVFWGLMYKAFYRVFAAFSNIKIPHDAGDFSLIDRRVAGWLLACPERDLFMRGLRAYVGFKQTGVDYIRPERMFGNSTNSFLKNIGWAKQAIFSYSSTPLNILTAVGGFLLLVSLGAGMITILLKILRPELAPRGATTTILSILFFGALNLFGIGILGEYIGKIIEEVKQRPSIIRSSIIRHGETSQLLPDGSVRR